MTFSMCTTKRQYSNKDTYFWQRLHICHAPTYNLCCIIYITQGETI